MSVQYKTSDGWKNISSSSNNAVDTVADGNMNPVTSNAVYDYPIDSITDGQHRPPTSNAVYDTIATLSPFNKAPSVVASTGAPDTSQVTQWTATKDCWVTAGVLTTASNGQAAINLSRDGGTTYLTLFGVTGQSAANNWPITLGFPVKKDWIVQIVGGYGNISAWI